MTDIAFTGEIRAFPYLRIVPADWMECRGQTLNCRQFPALFAIIGNRFGGDGTNSFQLPNFQGMAPVGATNNGGNPVPPLNVFTPVAVGKAIGSSYASLNATQMASHTHDLNAEHSGLAGHASLFSGSPTENVSYPAVSLNAANPTHLIPEPAFSPATPHTGTVNPDAPVLMAPQSLSATGGGAMHENRQPFAVVRLCICVNGIFPARSQ